MPKLTRRYRTTTDPRATSWKEGSAVPTKKERLAKAKLTITGNLTHEQKQTIERGLLVNTPDIESINSPFTAKYC